MPSICFLNNNPTAATGIEPMITSQPSQASCESLDAPIFTPLATEQRKVIAHKGAGDVDDVARKVDEHGQQRAELNHGDRGGRLLSFERRRRRRRRAQSSREAKIRCAVELMGMNSVSPWTMPRMMA